MGKCQNCGFDEEGNFCRECGTRINQEESSIVKVNADVKPVPQNTERINIICPKCESQHHYDLTESQSVYHLTCSDCNTIFKSYIVNIRAKRGRGSKKDNKRTFSVRVLDSSGAEDLIEFVNADYQDFELRSKDRAVFSYIGNKLKVVQNLTVSRYMKVSEPHCFLATYIYGPTSAEVIMLRRFRDDVLLGSTFLSPAVSSYYHLSQIAIRWWGESRLFKAIFTELMKPVVKVINWYLHFPKTQD